jgi:hypothetical protein
MDLPVSVAVGYSSSDRRGFARFWWSVASRIASPATVEMDHLPLLCPELVAPVSDLALPDSALCRFVLQDPALYFVLPCCLYLDPDFRGSLPFYSVLDSPPNNHGPSEDV